MEIVIYQNKEFNGDDLFLDRECWRRKNNTSDITDICLKELGGNLMYLTGELCFKNPNFQLTENIITDEESEIYNDMTCICGYSRCSKLHIVEFKPTKLLFAVGSVCINKFKPINYELINRTDFCLICCEPLWYKTTFKHKKNGNKNYPYCNNCNNLLFLKKIFKIIK